MQRAGACTSASRSPRMERGQRKRAWPKVLVHQDRQVISTGGEVLHDLGADVFGFGQDADLDELLAFGE